MSLNFQPRPDDSDSIDSPEQEFISPTEDASVGESPGRELHMPHATAPKTTGPKVDIEREVIVLLPPKRERTVTLRVRRAGRGEPLIDLSDITIEPDVD